MNKRGLRWLPSSMIGLVAGGCLLAAAPLVGAVTLAVGALDRLSAHSERLVAEGVMVTRLGARLRDDLTDLQRNARQYLVLGDEALLHLFFERLEASEITLHQIQANGLGPQFGERMQRIRDGLQQEARNWSEDSARIDASAVSHLQSLLEETETVIEAGRQSIDAEMLQLRSATQQARQIIWVISIALAPLTALLAFGFSIAVTRPLKRISTGILELGHAQYDQPIQVGFPREMQRLGERLDWLRRRLQRLENDKDHFLRSVSHELKTPLASLREGAALLSERSLGPLNDAQAEVAEILGEAARELELLIGNLLAYAEWRRERRDAHAEHFEVQPMIESLLGAHKLVLKRRELEPRVQLNSPKLRGQRARLREALDNLLGNAIKHAPAGSAIEISAGRQQDHWVISVRDYGRGVSADDREKIFEPFYRGTESEETSIRGTGVGLSIVRETMLAHQGTVEIEDAQPGARFTLRWPDALPDH